jgi:hypothetical protein
MDYSYFFIVGNALNKENIIIFFLLDDLDSLHGKLPQYVTCQSKNSAGQLLGVRVHLDIFSENGSRLVTFLKIASRGLLSGG